MGDGPWWPWDIFIAIVFVNKANLCGQAAGTRYFEPSFDAPLPLCEARLR